ncbi:transcription factor IIIB 50 kDa subunit isoform X2 [Notamacropus eugenii]|uniref:transcription factor IIIB 50 kDa subunit isoform X2 n=1 Tax=Notamacropus eugenii TaxID=9315 RepID=UPI003B676894
MRGGSDVRPGGERGGATIGSGKVRRLEASPQLRKIGVGRRWEKVSSRRQQLEQLHPELGSCSRSEAEPAPKMSGGGPGRCPDCGCAELVEDSHYAQSQLVCAECGCVVSEGLLTTTFADEGNLREVTYSRSTGENERVSRSQQRGLRRVRDLCRVLQLPSTFEDTAVSYYQRAFQHPGLHAARLQKKEVFKLFQTSPSVPVKFVEDKEKMVSRTLQLVELASETWLVTGRHPVPVITAAAYLAWRSLQPGGRSTCSLSRFCKLAGVDLPHPAYLRVQELLAILLRMAGQLAWLRILNLDKQTVVKHIGDLLQHRCILLRQAFRDEAEEEGEDEQQHEEGEEARSSALETLEKKRPAGSPPPLLPPCMLRPPKRPCPPPTDPSITGDEEISDSEIEQYLRTPREIKDFQRAQALSQAAPGAPAPSRLTS